MYEYHKGYKIVYTQVYVYKITAVIRNSIHNLI